MTSIVCTLPWPPSANHAWRPTRGGGKILSDKYKLFKQDVGDCVLMQRVRRHWHTNQSLIIAVACRPPNLRSFDIDNRLKTLIDALAGAGVIGDDKYVDMIVVRRASLDPPKGSVTVRIDQLIPADTKGPIGDPMTRAQFHMVRGFDTWFVGAEGFDSEATAAA